VSLADLISRGARLVPRPWLVRLNRHPLLRDGVKAVVDSFVRRGLGGGVREVVVPSGPLKGARLVLDFDHPGERAIWLDTYEPWFQRKVVEVVRPDMVLFDVGAYIGTYALLVRRVAPGIRVVAIEPDPRNLKRLEENLARNGAADVVVVQNAVAAGEGEVSFGGSGMHSHVGDGEMVVHAVTLDSLAQRFGPPQVVLMDIQGGEADALGGAGWLLNEVRPTWLVELHGEEGLQAAQRLREAGYTLETPDPRAGVAELLERSHRTHVVARAQTAPG
jgi:FkbM family methyltransferase